MVVQSYSNGERRERIGEREPPFLISRSIQDSKARSKYFEEPVFHTSNYILSLALSKTIERESRKDRGKLFKCLELVWRDKCASRDTLWHISKMYPVHHGRRPTLSVKY